MSLLELAREILEATKTIQRALLTQNDDVLPELFEGRQELITKYLELEAEVLEQEKANGEIQALMREGFKLNQQIIMQMQQKRQQLMQEMQMGGQMREATNAYSSPYDNVREPMFFDKKK